MLNSCHPNRTLKDQIVLGHIAFDTLSKEKKLGDKRNGFVGVYIEGRPTLFDSYELLASLKSFKLYSFCNYPLYCFIYKESVDSFVSFLKQYNENIIKDWNINIIPIDLIDSREKLTKFMVEKLFFLLPDESIWAVILQPDSGFISKGWEDFIIKGDFDYISAHWRHFPSIEIKISSGEWGSLFRDGVRIGNGGMSVRRIKLCQQISEKFSKVEQREKGTENRFPPEDLFFSYWGQQFNIFKNIPTLKECDRFCLDPIELSQFLNKESYSFHCPKWKSEWPKCTHN